MRELGVNSFSFSPSLSVFPWMALGKGLYLKYHIHMGYLVSGSILFIQCNTHTENIHPVKHVIKIFCGWLVLRLWSLLSFVYAYTTLKAALCADSCGGPIGLLDQNLRADFQTPGSQCAPRADYNWMACTCTLLLPAHSWMALLHLLFLPSRSQLNDQIHMHLFFPHLHSQLSGPLLWPKPKGQIPWYSWLKKYTLIKTLKDLNF